MEIAHFDPTYEAPDDDYKLHRRFDRMGRLVGDDGMKALLSAHVVVFGIGGVGSFAAEALARAGVGRLTLVDFDLVCITNSNRQLHAMKGTIGKVKVDIMAERLARINPQGTVTPVRAFYNAETSETLLAERPDFVVDAIDNITAKCHLIATCRERGIPLVSSAGAAARLDPTRVRVADLSETRIDPMAKAVRKILRERYGFPEKGPYGVLAVYSEEEPILPSELAYDNGEGFRCVCPQGQNGLHECEKRNRIDGTAGFVTGAFGLACASVAVKALVAKPG